MWGTPWGLWDLSSSTKDQTWAAAVKVPSLNHWWLLFNCSVMSDSLQPHGLQHSSLPCPSLFPRVYLSSCPLSWWCHPTISFSVIPFSSCLQSFPPSGSFPMSLLFASGGQSIGASASASVLPMNIQDWITTGPNHWTTREFPSWFWFTFR